MNDHAPKALIMTVGLPGDQGGDVLDALSLDIHTLMPAFLCLLCSKQSADNARRMKERCEFGDEHFELVTLDSAHDMDEIFQATNAIISRLIGRGYEPEQIAINYTSGTKVMGSGAVLSALYNRILELRYITGLAAPGDTRRHRILTTRPSGVFAFQELMEARRMAMDLRLYSAHRALENCDVEYLSDVDRALQVSLLELTLAYDHWESFYPSAFLERYRKVDFSIQALAPFQLSAGQLEAVESLVKEYKQGRPGPGILVDLYNNAARRLLMGRTEDALGRLYRALEMLAQWVLRRDFDIDTNDVETRKIPPRDRVAFEALRSMDDGLVKIGLRKAYDLLTILKTPVGLHFQQDTVLRGLLERRGGSILAHGFSPAQPEDARKFLCHMRELFSVEIEHFDALCLDLQFPWLEERLRELENISTG